MLCSLLAACDGGTWNPFQARRDLQSWQLTLKRADEALDRLPEPRVVAQAHQRIGFHGRAGDPAWLVLDLGHSITPDEIVLLPARVSDPVSDDPIGGFPSAVACELSETGVEGSFIRLAEWHEASDGLARDLPLLRLHNHGITGRYLRIEVKGFRAHSRAQFFTLGEVVVLEKGINRALGTAVTTSPSIDNPPRWSAVNLTDGYLWCGSLTGGEKSRMNGFHSAIESSPEAVPKWVEIDLGETVPVDEIRLVPARPPDYADITGFGFPPSFQVIVFGEARKEGTPLFNGALPNPGDATVCIPGQGVSARRIRVVATSLWQRTQDYIFALAEMQVLSQGHNIAWGKPVTASDAVPSALWSNPSLVDGFSSQRELLDWPAWLEMVEKRASLERDRAAAERHLAQAGTAFQESLIRSMSASVTSLFLSVGILLLMTRWRQARAQAALRQRIARDLHDEMGSQLSHLALLAEAGKHRSTSAEATAASFSNIASEARDLQHAMRDLVWLLEPQSGDAADFAVRLRSTCQRLLAPVIADVQIDISGIPPARRLPLEWTRDLLLFIKEALNNCARHSQSSSVRIGMQWTDRSFEWQITDDGIGFDENADAFEAGAGLRNLRLRTTALQAKLSLISSPGTGTQIRLSVPLPTPRRFPFSNRS